MGWPSEGTEAFYRNPMSEVQRFLTTKHAGHYKLWNLCAENKYEHAKFEGRVEEFGFLDHNPPPFQLIHPICESVNTWLTADAENLAVVHCKAGKGRTGVIICSLLMYQGVCKHPLDALTLFGKQRTFNNKGVTIPSQRRYVFYYAQYVANGFKLPTYQPDLKLDKIRIHTTPNVGFATAFKPWIEITTRGVAQAVKKFPLEKTVGEDGQDQWDLFLSFLELPLEGDIKIKLYQGKDTELCWFWFNSHFIVDDKLHLQKYEIDHALSDTKNRVFKEDFSIELLFDGGDNKAGDFPQFEDQVQKPDDDEDEEGNVVGEDGSPILSSTSSPALASSPPPASSSSMPETSLTSPAATTPTAAAETASTAPTQTVTEAASSSPA